MMAQLVHYIGRSEAFTSHAKTEMMNVICAEMEGDGFRLISAIPDIGSDGATAGVWLFFSHLERLQTIPPFMAAQPSADNSLPRALS